MGDATQTESVSGGADFQSDPDLLTENEGASVAVPIENKQEGAIPGHANADTEQAPIAKAGEVAESTVSEKEDTHEMGEERKKGNDQNAQINETEDRTSVSVTQEQDHAAEGGKGVQQERPEMHADTGVGVSINSGTSGGKGRGRGRITKPATETLTPPKAR